MNGFSVNLNTFGTNSNRKVVNFFLSDATIFQLKLLILLTTTENY